MSGKRKVIICSNKVILFILLSKIANYYTTFNYTIAKNLPAHITKKDTEKPLDYNHLSKTQSN